MASRQTLPAMGSGLPCEHNIYYNIYGLTNKIFVYFLVLKKVYTFLILLNIAAMRVK